MEYHFCREGFYMKRTVILLSLLTLTACSSTQPMSSTSSTVDAKEETTYVEGDTINYGIYQVTVPEGFNATTTTKKIGTSNTDMHIITLYYGDIDTSNPYITLSSYERIEDDNDWKPDQDYGEYQIGDYSYKIQYDGYPYTYIDRNDEKTYDYILEDEQLFNRISFSYFDHEKGTWDEDAILDIIESLQLNTIGEITINRSYINVRYQDSKSSQLMGKINQGETYQVYEVKEDDSSTWYRIGDYSWINAEKEDWVTYKSI